MIQNKLYIIVVLMAFLVYTLVFTLFPRSTFSNLEKRELCKFPVFSMERLLNGTFTKDVSFWFNDSEPFRDVFMSQSMYIKNYQKLDILEENVTFHAPVTECKNACDALLQPIIDSAGVKIKNNCAVEEYHNQVTANENAKITNAGIIIVGNGDNVRALMVYGGKSNSGIKYAAAVNKYKETFGDAVNIYCMVIPTAIEFYCPDKVEKCTKKELPTINNIYENLHELVKPVDVYTILSQHVNENIYLRTDHHWAPLGAYYAASKFAEIANVPFNKLSEYDEQMVQGYVGSMYGYSRDIAVKKAPETFIYHLPRNVEYTTTYINYVIDEKYQVVDESPPVKGNFFVKFPDGSSGAYCTFMGGDSKITQVKTSTQNNRRLIILKDSFGNAIPGYLFFSFEEIHVIDYRYFTKDIKTYVEEYNITDILFANNIFPSCSSYIAKRYIQFLK